MIVRIEMEIITTDYDGVIFKKEIERLIDDIDPESELWKFKMWVPKKHKDTRSIDWDK
jgi:hypothetical protein